MQNFENENAEADHQKLEEQKSEVQVGDCTIRKAQNAMLDAMLDSIERRKDTSNQNMYTHRFHT